jgi:hypothetical protein
VLRVGENSSYKPVIVNNLPVVNNLPGRGVSKSSARREGNNEPHERSRASRGGARPSFDSETHDFMISDVLISTTAAPTYFPSYCGTVDGGVFANNPSLIALTKVCEAGMATPRQVRILSISTGCRPEPDSGKVDSAEQPSYQDWGLLQWAPSLVDMLMESSSSASDYACR